MKKTIILGALAVVIFLALSVGMDCIGGAGRNVSVYIPPGSGADKIINILHEKGVIQHPWLFKMLLKDEDMLSFKAGVHEMKTSMGYKAAVAELLKIVPMGNTVKVVIPEGFELKDIAAALEEKGVVGREEFLKAAREKYDYDFLAGIERGDNYLEGYLYPATYELTPSMSGQQVIRLMLDRFSIMLKDEYKARAKELGMSIHEVLTLASIIEREAAVESEREIISSVFHNRLKNKSYPYLESCATIQYILGERREVLSYEDTRIKSPYNTYINPGLPPGPIASPGEASFRAALYPADTDYLFFVAAGGGRHIFSRTYEEHLKAQGE